MVSLCVSCAASTGVVVASAHRQIFSNDYRDWDDNSVIRSAEPVMQTSIRVELIWLISKIPSSITALPGVICSVCGLRVLPK
jgi:hypothetical protein